VNEREDEAQFELEKEAQFKPEPIQEVEPNYEARRKGHALKSNEGIMVVYDAPPLPSNLAQQPTQPAQNTDVFTAIWQAIDGFLRLLGGGIPFYVKMY